MTEWTPALNSALKELWADELPAREIARRLGLPSKSSVIGRAYRMGLPRRRTPRPEVPEAPVQREAEGVPLSDLKPDQCRWPVSTEGKVHRFCGEPAVGSRPYCFHHCRRAYARESANAVS